MHVSWNALKNSHLLANIALGFYGWFFGDGFCLKVVKSKSLIL